MTDEKNASERPKALTKEPEPGASEDTIDLLYGMPAIAKFLGLKKDKVYYLHRKGTIPTFPIDGTICSRKSSLIAWLAQKEANARKLTEALPPGAGDVGQDGEE